MWMIGSVLKGMANVALTLAFFAFCGWWVFVGYMDELRRQEDPTFAEELFTGLLPVSKVLESRKWHTRGAEPWDCTYAIVRLSSDLPQSPPSREWRNDLGWQYEFGGDWQQTPASALRDTTRDAVGFCAKYWPEALGAELTAVLSRPGAWYVRDPVGETVFLYAPQNRLAARIRFGD